MTLHLEDVKMGMMPVTIPVVSPRFHLERSPRRVRAVFGGETLADSTHALLLREVGRLPVYYFPWADVRAEALERTARTTSSEFKGDATYWTIRQGDRVAENAAWSYEAPVADGPDLKGFVAFYWNEMDAWYEEDERAYAHPRDPYKMGVDTRHSARHVVAQIAGVTIAETHHPILLFEMGLPIRYYIAANDVRMDLLEPSATTSQCAYKGEASYWSARIGECLFTDVAWTYREPLVVATPVADMVAFFQERVDAIIVDGEHIERPQTPWSR